MSATTTTTTTTTTNTLAARAAGLLSKTAAYAVAEKALQQAITAKRVYPAMAEDFGQQLGVELPLKTKDFTRVVGHMLAASEKPLKGVISKRKSDILAVLADLVGALTDTAPIALPSWAIPKERTKKAEAEAVDVSGALDRANAQAEANEAAEALAGAALTEAKNDNALAKAVAVVVANAAALTEAQREALALALASTEPALM
jgi:hypothetical protein